MTRWGSRGAVAGAGAALLMLAACSSNESGQEAGAVDCAADGTTCIGLVLEGGSVDDGAFNAAAWAGVQEAAEASGAVAEYVESDGPSAYADHLSALADRGFDVVVTTDVGRPELTREAAAAHPGTQFIAISQDMADATGNATGLLFADDAAGYAAGYLAGSVSATGVVGAVLGSEEVLPLRRFGEGYRLGALAARPDATVLMDYHTIEGDSFNDPEWGADTARAQIAQGADVIFGAGGTTGTGALTAVADSPGAGDGLLCIGIDVDQYLTVPEARPCLITSAQKMIAESVADAAIGALAGTDLPATVDGSIGLAPYRDLEARIPAEVRDRVAEVLQGLKDGSVATGVTF